MKKIILGTILVLLLSVSSALAMDVTLGWDANTESDLAGYKVYYGEVQGGPYTGTGATDGASPITVPLGALVNVSAPMFIVKGLPDNRKIWFVVTAYDSEVPALESGYSNEVVAYYGMGIPPAPPKNLIMKLIQWLLSKLGLLGVLEIS